MIHYLLEKFERIKMQHKLYCNELENNMKEHPHNVHYYDFICKNTRGQGPLRPAVDERPADNQNPIETQRPADNSHTKSG